ncbi:hypothetical protein [Muriicola soli]|uniref:Uncharacterized protein n=1 Tax=Muriicola soli TaxID=2507538 RepID=A0A411EAN8_9FLAO|nr:hypothetical protein [Muriicola soli]QBA64792.1 hypothetical protein EQY75_09795 [Muriicola soli]
MNIVNIIEGIERLVVSLLFWLIFIPKTLFKVVSNPKWVEGYVTRELKAETDRFQNYMSPIILYLLNSVFLVFVYIFIKRDILKDINSTKDNEITSVWDQIVSGLDISGDMITNLSGSYGFVSAAVFLTFPLFFGLVIELLKNEDLNREALRRATYIQCYYFTPLALTFCMIILSSSLLQPLEQNFIVVTFLIFFIWFTLTEIRFITKELRRKSFGSTLIYFGIFLVIIAGSFGVISVFAIFDEDRNKITGDEYVLPEINNSSSTYSLIVKCQTCLRSSSDSLVIDAVFTAPGGTIENREINLPVQPESEIVLEIPGEYKTLKLEASENLRHELYIDVLDTNGYSIIGGIKSWKAMLVRKIGSYLLLVLLAIPVFIWLRSLVRKEYNK